MATIQLFICSWRFVHWCINGFCWTGMTSWHWWLHRNQISAKFKSWFLSTQRCDTRQTDGMNNKLVTPSRISFVWKWSDMHLIHMIMMPYEKQTRWLGWSLSAESDSNNSLLKKSLMHVCREKDIFSKQETFNMSELRFWNEWHRMLFMWVGRKWSYVLFFSNTFEHLKAAWIRILKM